MQFKVRMECIAIKEFSSTITSRLIVSCRTLLRLISFVLPITLGLFYLPAQAWPKIFSRNGVTLFNSEQHPHFFYERIVSNLKPGQVLIFSDGRRIEVKSVLSKETPGYRSVIVEDAITGNAFRLALRAKRNFGRKDLRQYLESYQETMRRLNEDGAPSVKVISHLPWEYVEMEKIDVVMSLKEFLQNYPNVDKEKYEDLFRFAREVAIYTSIGDAGSQNIVYAQGRGWIILDVGEGVFYYDKNRSHHKSEILKGYSIFTDLASQLAPELRTRLNEVIKSARSLACYQVANSAP